MSWEELKETLRRWFTENSADTRGSGPPPGRLYAAPFARVWDALLEDVHGRRGWDLTHADEDLGMLTVRCRMPVFRFMDDLTLWVGLDDNGMTRVDARSRSRVGRGDLGVNRRRIEGIMTRLDQAVGEGARLE